MTEVWTITRVKKVFKFGKNKHGSFIEWEEEEWTTGKGKTKEDAIIDFEINRRIKHENTALIRDKSRPYGRGSSWGSGNRKLRAISGV